MRGQHDRHVQAWVEDRVKALALLEQLAKLTARLEKRNTAHVEVWRGTQYKPNSDGCLVAVKTYEVRSQ